MAGIVADHARSVVYNSSRALRKQFNNNNGSGTRILHGRVYAIIVYLYTYAYIIVYHNNAHASVRAA